MNSKKYLRVANRIINKINNAIPLSNDEIANYYGIEVKLVKNICSMYKNFGRDSVISITLSDEEIDDIIRIKYPYMFKENKHKKVLRSRSTF